MQRGAEIVGRQSILTTGGGGQHQNMYVAEWNEVPIVADKIVLLPWLLSLSPFEHNKCGLLCCWRDTNDVSHAAPAALTSACCGARVAFIASHSVRLVRNVQLGGSEIGASRGYVHTRKSCARGG